VKATELDSERTFDVEIDDDKAIDGWVAIDERLGSEEDAHEAYVQAQTDYPAHAVRIVELLVQRFVVIPETLRRREG